LEEWATSEEKLLIFQEKTSVPNGKRFWNMQGLLRRWRSVL
jgi:hypothetical protein